MSVFEKKSHFVNPKKQDYGRFLKLRVKKFDFQILINFDRKKHVLLLYAIYRYTIAHFVFALQPVAQVQKFA